MQPILPILQMLQPYMKMFVSVLPWVLVAVLALIIWEVTHVKNARVEDARTGKTQ